MHAVLAATALGLQLTFFKAETERDVVKHDDCLAKATLLQAIFFTLERGILAKHNHFLVKAVVLQIGLSTTGRVSQKATSSV